VHAKVTLSSDRKYYKKVVMMMIEKVVMMNDLCNFKRSSFLSNDLKTIMFFQIELFEIFLTFEVFISCSARARENDTQQ
jgi:hypothetical protein